jgi:hypothetical protein
VEKQNDRSVSVGLAGQRSGLSLTPLPGPTGRPPLPGLQPRRDERAQLSGRDGEQAMADGRELRAAFRPRERSFPAVGLGSRSASRATRG